MARPEKLSQAEFIAMIAMLFATVAFSIDAMLPALPQIAGELTPDAPNRVQLILTSFLLGMGAGTFITGPLSDAFGRKPIILLGAGLYTLGAFAAWQAQSLELMLAARVVQGVGAAGPRIATLALVRDLYSGRQMAKVVSIAMMIFTLVPAIAPALGAGIIAVSGWRTIFLAFITFSGLTMLWLGLRQRETLPPAARRKLHGATLLASVREVLSNRVIVTAIAAQTCSYAVLFATISSTQQIFDITFDRAAGFPFWFAIIALISGTASLLNAAIVVRLGMRFLITISFAVQVPLSLLMAGITAADLWPAGFYFPAYIAWTTSVFFIAGLTLGNLNALAMEPVGHIAGMAASIVSALATVLGVLVAVPVGLAFNGTPVPLATGIALLSAISLGLMRTIPRPK